MSTLPKELLDKLAKRNGVSEDNFDLTLDDINSFGDDDSIREMYSSIASYRRMLMENITFINPELTALVPFTRQNLYLLCATSGTGKSTAAANISFPLWKQQKKVLILGNEESKEDVLFRIACLELGYNFNAYKKNKMPAALMKQVMALFPEIAEYVKVIDVADRNGITSHADGIRHILNKVKDADFSCILIDYWQNIKKTSQPDASHYNILDDLRIFLGQYIKSCSVPVVVFAQIYPAAGKRSTVVEDRIKMGKTIYETATVVLEIITDFATKSTKFSIIKDRFGNQGSYLNTYYDNGKYIAISEEELKELLNNAKVEDLNGKLNMGEDDTYGEDDEPEQE